jgi:3-hydroxyacyl-[acyl-carrier-protein] dehydratase
MAVANNSGAHAEPIGVAAVNDYTRKMMQKTELGPDQQSRRRGAKRKFTAEDDAQLRDALKRCSPSTRDAACAFRRTGSPEQLPAIIHGLIEHYVARGARAKLSRSDDGARLVEDLAIDSLTMLEIVFMAEDVLQISIDNDELRPFRTVGDVKKFIASKLTRSSA